MCVHTARHLQCLLPARHWEGVPDSRHQVRDWTTGADAVAEGFRRLRQEKSSTAISKLSAEPALASTAPDALEGSSAHSSVSNTAGERERDGNPRSKRSSSELVVGPGHVDGPAELFPLRLVVDLLDGDVELLAPGDGDPGVEVVQLGGAQGDRLVLLLVNGLKQIPVSEYSAMQSLHG